MDIFIIKLALTPLSMLGVSLVARRWGSLIGGLIAGLPLTSGPISIYLAIEQGPEFAARAAVGALSGTSATLVAYACYVWLTRRHGVLLSCIASLLAFAIPAFVMLRLDELSVAVVVCPLAITVTIALTQDVEKASGDGEPPPLWDLPARLTASTAMVLAITGLAPRLGPALSGVLAPIPVIAWPLIVFCHLHGGRDDAISAVRGAAAGTSGILAFYIIVAKCISGHGLLPVYAASVGASVVICALAGFALERLSRRTGSSRAAGRDRPSACQ